MTKWIRKNIYRVFISLSLVGVVGAGVINKQTPLDTAMEIQQAQEAYFQANGEYLQILRDNKLPSYEAGTVEQKLGKNVATNYKVNIYETPKKEKGYQIIEIDEWGRTRSVGYGVMADILTYQDENFGVNLSSTSTPQ